VSDEALCALQSELLSLSSAGHALELVVIHCAASVNFVEPLHRAGRINTVGPLNVKALAAAIAAAAVSGSTHSAGNQTPVDGKSDGIDDRSKNSDGGRFDGGGRSTESAPEPDLPSPPLPLNRATVRMVHVSTAFVHPRPSQKQPHGLQEAIVPLGGFDAQRLRESMCQPRKNGTNKDSIDVAEVVAVEAEAAMKQLNFPNTYTFTKCVAEHLLLRDQLPVLPSTTSPVDHSSHVDVQIVRPGVVGPSWCEPFPSWAGETPSTVTACGYLIARGAARTFHVAGPVLTQESGGAQTDQARKKALPECPAAPVIPVDVLSRTILQRAFFVDNSVPAGSADTAGSDGLPGEDASRSSSLSRIAHAVWPWRPSSPCAMEQASAAMASPPASTMCSFSRMFDVFFFYAAAKGHSAKGHSARGHPPLMSPALALLCAGLMQCSKWLTQWSAFAKLHAIANLLPIKCYIVYLRCRKVISGGSAPPASKKNRHPLERFAGLPLLFEPFTHQTWRFDTRQSKLQALAPADFDPEEYAVSVAMAVERFVHDERAKRDANRGDKYADGEDGVDGGSDEARQLQWMEQLRGTVDLLDGTGEDGTGVTTASSPRAHSTSADVAPSQGWWWPLVAIFSALRLLPQLASDGWWSLTRPIGSLWQRFGAFLLRCVLRLVFSELRLDLGSFAAAATKLRELHEQHDAQMSDQLDPHQCQPRPPSLLVLVPTHRSFLDFLLLSYVCLASPALRMAPPRVAASSEFKRVPGVGWLMSRMGAFFIDRSSDSSASAPGDVSGGTPGGPSSADGATLRRREALQRQVDDVLGTMRDEEGEERKDAPSNKADAPSFAPTFEFFIEGTRSRDRRHLKPKTGLVRCLQDFLQRDSSSSASTNGVEANAVLLPIAVSYERVPEQATLASELLMEPKKPFSLFSLLCWIRGLVGARLGVVVGQQQGQFVCGRVNVRAGKPLLMFPPKPPSSTSNKSSNSSTPECPSTPTQLECALECADRSNSYDPRDARQVAMAVQHEHRRATTVSMGFHLALAERHLGLPKETIAKAVKFMHRHLYPEEGCQEQQEPLWSPILEDSDDAALSAPLWAEGDGEQDAWIAHMQWASLFALPLHQLRQAVAHKENNGHTQTCDWAAWLDPDVEKLAAVHRKVPLPPPKTVAQQEQEQVVHDAETTTDEQLKQAECVDDAEQEVAAALAAAKSSSTPELRSMFRWCADTVSNGGTETGISVGNDTKLRLYGLYKFVHTGPSPSVATAKTSASSAPPSTWLSSLSSLSASAFDVVGRSKADAWRTVSQRYWADRECKVLRTPAEMEGVEGVEGAEAMLVQAKAEAMVEYVQLIGASRLVDWPTLLKRLQQLQKPDAHSGTPTAAGTPRSSSSSSSFSSSSSSSSFSSSSSKTDSECVMRVCMVLEHYFKKVERKVDCTHREIAAAGFCDFESTDPASGDGTYDGSRDDMKRHWLKYCTKFLPCAPLSTGCTIEQSTACPASLCQYVIDCRLSHIRKRPDPTSPQAPRASETAQAQEQREDAPEQPSNRMPSVELPTQAPTSDSTPETYGAWGFNDSRFEVVANDGSEGDGEGGPYVRMTGDRYPICGKRMHKLLPFLQREMQLPPSALAGAGTAPTAIPNPHSAPVPDEGSVPVSVFTAPASEIEQPPSESSALSPSACWAQVVALLGPTNVTTDVLECVRHGHGHTQEDVCAMRSGKIGHRVPDGVVRPESEAQVLEVVRIASRSRWCLVPYGGGTNVTHALRCPTVEQDPRPMVSVDMKRMAKVLWLDKGDGIACIEAGAVGGSMERDLQATYGVTTGHEPDSMEFSTLGGWVATRASGMKKNRYGNIEDIVMEVRVATPSGMLWQHHDHDPTQTQQQQQQRKSGAVSGVTSRASSSDESNSSSYGAFSRVSTGMDLSQVMLGSEGNLGIITSVVLRVRPVPAVREYDSALFPCFEDGVNFMRKAGQELPRSGCGRPASVRLVDNLQFRLGQSLSGSEPPSTTTTVQGSSGSSGTAMQATQVALKSVVTAAALLWQGLDPSRMVAATMLFEGTVEEVAAQRAAVQKLIRKCGGMLAGPAHGESGYRLTYAIAYLRDFALSHNVLAESFETFVPWSKLEAMIERVRQRIHQEHEARRLPAAPLFSARVTQVYEEGACVYFYLALYIKGVGDSAVDNLCPCGPGKLNNDVGSGVNLSRASTAFAEIEHAARDEVLSAGGSLSHHHGIGKIRAPFMKRTSAPAVASWTKGIKLAIDPENVFGAANSFCAVE
jgi:alkyldihydroxyacetonephosphate synthase